MRVPVAAPVNIQPSEPTQTAYKKLPAYKKIGGAGRSGERARRIAVDSEERRPSRFEVDDAKPRPLRNRHPFYRLALPRNVLEHHTSPRLFLTLVGPPVYGILITRASFGI